MLAHLPIIRTYLFVVAVYYVIMTGAHLIVRHDYERALLATSTLSTAMVALAAWWWLGRRAGPATIDLLVLLVNALVVANVQLAFTLAFDPNKLVYFLLMTMVFAMTSTSLRQAAPGIILALLCLFTTITREAPQLFAVYAYMSIAAVLASAGTAHTLRRAFTRAITARHAAEDRESEARLLAQTARAQAGTDSLTGIANRRSFFDMLERGWSDQPPDRHVCLIAIDLDGFKPVNDHHGHRAGDLLLKAVARRLRLTLPPPAFVARIGGDEFMAMLIVDDPDGEPVAQCERLRHAIAEPAAIGEDMVHVSGSIGCAVEQVATADGCRLAEQADFALYHAKKSAKGQAVVFGPALAVAQHERAGIDQALRRGDLAEEIEVLFQPQWDLATGRVTGAEALARWHSSRLGTITPDRFIPLAEQSGLIGSITRVVVRKALLQAARWPAGWTVSINISAHDLLSEAVVGDLIALAAASPVDPARIEFEITETAMVTDLDRALRQLDRLTGCGHRIALDDFGTGYSNFDHLSRLPFSKLKIDRSFVRAWNQGGHASKLIKTMIDMSRVLGTDCVLEGVETREQLDLAAASGATIVQGYLFGPPMTSEDLLRRFVPAATGRRRAG